MLTMHDGVRQGAAIVFAIGNMLSPTFGHIRVLIVEKPTPSS
jgi:hypothetical protein